MRTLLHAFFLVMLLAFGLPAFADNFTDGVEFFRNEQYQRALYEFQAGTKQDDPRCQYALGLMYAIGNHIDQDDAKAFSWIQKSHPGKRR